MITAAGAPTVIQCIRSPNGRHELGARIDLIAYHEKQFPTGTEICLECRHCKARGWAILEDASIRWHDAEKLPR